MAYAEPKGIETCPICGCIMVKGEPPAGMGAWKKKVKTPQLSAYGLDYLCSSCCPNSDVQEIMSRIAKKAHNEGMEEERRGVMKFLRRYLPPREPSIFERRF